MSTSWPQRRVVEHHGLDRAGACGCGLGRVEAIVDAVVATLDRGVPVLPDELQIVGGVLGDEGDDAAERIAAVERGGRPANDLDALQRIVVDEVARVGAGAEIGAGKVRHLDAVDLQPHAVLADAADHEVGGAGAPRLVADGEARLVAHELARRVDVLALHLGRRLDGHGAGRVVDGGGRLFRARRQRIEAGRIGAGGGRRWRRLRAWRARPRVVRCLDHDRTENGALRRHWRRRRRLLRLALLRLRPTANREGAHLCAHRCDNHRRCRRAAGKPPRHTPGHLPRAPTPTCSSYGG